MKERTHSTFSIVNSTFLTGDGPSALPDPRFVARAGETNRVTILIGKTYTVTCPMPIACIGKSDMAIGVVQESDREWSNGWKEWNIPTGWGDLFPTVSLKSKLHARQTEAKNAIIQPMRTRLILQWRMCYGDTN